MKIKPPKIGQTYHSRTAPNPLIYVVDVTYPDAGEDADSEFIVEGCDPAYKDDTINADGLEFTADVWVKYAYTQVAK
jgi:hypothetical protein